MYSNFTKLSLYRELTPQWSTENIGAETFGVSTYLWCTAVGRRRRRDVNIDVGPSSWDIWWWITEHGRPLSSRRRRRAEAIRLKRAVTLRSGGSSATWRTLMNL